MLRTVKRIALVVAALVVVCFTALVVLARVYDAEVKAKLVGTLNGYLTAPVSVSSMDLTLIERFPQASIHLRDVLARDAITRKDTLLFAGDLYLEFDLWNLFSGDYSVDEVHGEHVIVHPGVDSTGAGNWIIWKTDSTGTGTDLALDRVTMKDLAVRYRDARSGLDVGATSERLALSGRFAGTGNTVKVEGDAWLAEWRDRSGTVLSDRKASVRLELAFGGSDGAFRITKGEVQSGDVPLAVTMELKPGVKGDVLDLRANGLGLDLADVLHLLPDRARRSFARYGMQGEMDLALTYRGPLDPGPALSLGLNVRNGTMEERRSGARFKAINGECAIEVTPRGDLSRLLVKKFSAKAASGTISGSWDMKGLTNAPLRADLKGDIALADLLRFAQVDTLEEVEGRLVVAARVEGKLRNVNDPRPVDLRALRISGTATLKNATLKMKGIRHVVKDLNTTLALDGNDAHVSDLRCSVQGNALQLSGELRNLWSYLLFDQQPLWIAAQGSSPRLDLATLLQEGEVSRGAKDYALTLPSLVRLDLKARVDELVFEEFTATDINGTIAIDDRVLRVSPMMFNTAGGGVLGALTLDARQAPYPLAIDATAKDIDVTRLFREFQEFGQAFITSRHLSGSADAQVSFRSPLTPGMQLDLDRLRCTVDIAIADGGIKGHQPLIDIADYVRRTKAVAPFVDTDELRASLADVRFAQLENRIEIRDRQVIIPAMVVRNSAMDIELSGTHGFDDMVDHHLNFRLSDLMKKKGSDDSFGPVIDDGTGLRIFLHMYGLASAPQFETDGAMAAQRRREGIRQETAELRSILHNELNPFRKNDTTGVQAPAGGVRITVEADSTAGQHLADKPKRKGPGALFEEKPPPREVIEVED